MANAKFMNQKCLYQILLPVRSYASIFVPQFPSQNIGETKAHSRHVRRCSIISPACGAPSGMLGVVPGPGSLRKGAGSPELSSGGNRELEHALADACRLLSSVGKMHT